MDAGTRVEILFFDDCPNAVAARELVERISAELAIEPEISLIRVETPEAAKQTRFLGSPSIRVDGRDVEPGAEARAEYVLSCRVYRTATGLTGRPEDAWVRDALIEAMS